MISELLHGAIRLAASLEARRFERALDDPESAQRSRLRQILAVCSGTPAGREAGLSTSMSAEELAARLPVSEYGHWRDRIEEERSGRPTLCRSIARFEPTSGSTGERKWIPYSPEFLAEMNRAARAWLHDLYVSHPGIARGAHFWSLSWIPNELRGLAETDDVELFPAWQRAFLRRVVVAHPALARAGTAEAAWWATLLVTAATRDLSFLSAWSPTYATGLVRSIFEERVAIGEALSGRRWLRHEPELARFAAPERVDFPSDASTLQELVRRCWPRLALVSAWDAASSRPFAEELRRALPGIPFQGKGLWATEGVVTIPWRGRLPLAVRSHYYEFRDLSSGEIRPAWKLRAGMEVQPLITGSHGLLRYALSDRLRVGEALSRCPTLEFLGRIGGSDLVGEKIGFEKAETVLALLTRRFPELSPICLLAGREEGRARYWVVAVGPANRAPELAAVLETELSSVHHYAVAREMGQILPAGARIAPTLREHESLLERNPIKGRNKPSPIVLLD